MLRDKQEKWRRKWSWSGAKNPANDITVSGEYRMNRFFPEGEDDPGYPNMEGFVGSNYWLTHRSLYNSGNIEDKNKWFSQVAYSYTEPCIGVRTHAGIEEGNPHSGEKWSPWEYTIMSGVIECVDTWTIFSDTTVKVTTTKNRNSNIVSIYLECTNLGSGTIPPGKHYLGRISNSIMWPHTGLRVLPISVIKLGSVGYGLASCVLVINTNGSVFLYNEYDHTTYQNIVNHQCLTYSIV